MKYLLILLTLSSLSTFAKTSFYSPGRQSNTASLVISSDSQYECEEKLKEVLNSFKQRNKIVTKVENFCNKKDYYSEVTVFKH